MDIYDLKLFDELDLFIFIADKRGNISFANRYFFDKFGKVSNIGEIEHLFMFDIYILDDSNILNYNPLNAALNLSEKYVASADFEVSYKQFQKVLIKAVNIDGKKLFFIDEEENVASLKNELTELQSQMNLYKKMKKDAENQSVKTALINRISSSIRDTVNENEIITKVISETLETLGAKKAVFIEYEKNKRFDFHTDENYFNALVSLRNKAEETLKIQTDSGDLCAPVLYRGHLLGLFLISYINKHKEWKQDEINLIEHICSQLAVAINQAYLFKELDTALTELKDTQVQLVQSEKMASLGHLVAGISHEINTPIGVINSNNDLMKKCLPKLQEKLPDENCLNVFLNSVEINSKAVERINKIVKSLKNFARLDESDMQESNINEGLTSTIELLNSEFGDRVKVITDFGEIPEIKCHANLLNQVFMNLLVNAAQSIETQGEIEVKTRLDKGNLLVIIKDSGMGIKKENIGRVFDPGFTTKGVGVGTGLGLSICFKIMQKHNGKIIVESEEGKGSVFTVELPVK